MPTVPATHRPPRIKLPDHRPTASRRGYGAAWKRLRDAHLAEHPLCVVCETRGETVAAQHVDHKVARASGGTDDQSNLQSLCWPCHSRKTALEDGGFGHMRGRGLKS